MSRTRVQQTQISGSLSSDILDNLAAGSELAVQSTLVGDLNAMRSQLNKIIGVGNWYDELSGTQDLADIYGAMQVSGADAAFQGDVSAVGDMSAVDGAFSGNLSAVSGSFSGNVSAVDATLSGNLSAANGTFSGHLSAMSLAIAEDVAQRLYIVGAEGEVKDESKLTFDGSELAIDGDVSADGDLSAVGEDFTVVAGYAAPPHAGDLGYGGFGISDGSYSFAVSGDRTGIFTNGTSLAVYDSGDWSLAPQARTVDTSGYDAGRNSTSVIVTSSFNGIASGNAVVIVVGNSSPAGASVSIPSVGASSTLTMDGDIKIVGDVAERLYIVGADGELKDEANLTYDGLEFAVIGDFAAVSGSFSGDISASAATFSSDLTVSGDFSGVDATLAGNLSAVDASLSGNLIAVNGTFSGPLLTSDDISAVNAVLSGDLTASGDISAITGSFSGPLTTSGDISAVNGTLSGSLSAVSGSFSGNITAVSGSFSGNVSIAGDVAQRLYIVGADGEIKDESKLTFDGSELVVDGDLSASGDLSAVGGDFSVAAGLAGTPEGGYLGYAAYGEAGAVTILGSNVAGLFPDGTSIAVYNSSDWSIPPHYTTVYWASGQPSGGAYNAGGAYTTMNLNTGMGALAYNAAVALVGNPAPSGAAVLINTSSPAVLSMTGSIKISGDVAQRLYIVGADGEIKDESKLTFDGSELAIDGNLAAVDGHFTGNVQVDGDLRVKGSMTYIDTQNMRVQDAFIYLATGSVGTTDSGIVLHGGAGADMDLVIGQDGGAGEVIFGKANRAPDGDGAMDGIELVSAWMNTVLIGATEGAMSGSMGIDGNDVQLSAANNLRLSANGHVIDLQSAADYTLFDSNFSATSIVGALNELYAAGAGGAAKGNLALSDVTVDVLDFSAVGTLNSADHKFIDVYLNGVLLAPGIDVTAVAVDNVTLAAGVVSELAVDDVFTVVLRGAAAS